MTARNAEEVARAGHLSKISQPTSPPISTNGTAAVRPPTVCADRYSAGTFERFAAKRERVLGGEVELSDDPTATPEIRELPDLAPRRIQFTRSDRRKRRTMTDVAGTDAVRWVGRPSKYGNPHPVESVTHMCGICGVGHDQADAVAEYARYLLADAERIVRARVELAGLTLACACPVGTPCHADLLVNIVDAHSDAAAVVVAIVAARPAIGGDDV